jgi:hypothetical protein
MRHTVTARQATLKPRDWPDFHGWEVFDGPDYLGLIGEYSDPLRYRAYGTRLGLDGEPVAVERECPTRDEAEAWLMGEAES